MDLRILLLIFLLIPSWAWADDLNCKEPSATIKGATVQFPGTATSVTANVMDPDDTTAPSFEPAMSAVGSGATNLWRAADFTLGASPTFGEWTIQYEGTVDGVVRWATDVFEVKAQCPITPTVAGRQILCDATGKCNAQVKDMDNDVITATKIAAGAITSSEAPNLDDAVSAVKAKTDQLTFTTANRVDSTDVDKTNYNLATNAIDKDKVADSLEAEFGIKTRVTVLAGNTHKFIIPINETISSDNDWVKSGFWLECGNERRQLALVDSTNKKIAVSPEFSSAPAGGTNCTVDR